MPSENQEATASETQEVKTEEATVMKLEIVDSLPDSEEEYEEHIAPVMSSFFSVDDKKDDTKEEDTTATILATQDAASTATDVMGPKGPKAQIVPQQ